MTRESETTLRKAAIWIGLAAGVFLAWELRPAILLAFGAVMLGTVFDLAAEAVCRASGMRRGWSFAIATTIIIAAIALFIWLFGMNLYQQFTQVAQRVTSGEASFNALLGRSGFGQSLVSSSSSIASSMIRSLVATGSELLEGAVIMLIAAIYLAARPESHREGAADFFPPGGPRSRFLRAIDAIGVVLKQWVLGQLVLMVTVGVLSTVAVSLIGLPNPVPLGLVAGLTEAIPYLGPWIGSVPALLVALTVSNSFSPVILTAVAYLGVHLVEGYVVGPIVQRWFVGIPPALMLLGIFAGQLIFGLPGVILGGPMTVAIFAGIKMVYLKQPVEAAEKKIRA
jgi:predicted PurR-regulated permease PerM